MPTLKFRRRSRRDEYDTEVISQPTNRGSDRSEADGWEDGPQIHPVVIWAALVLASIVALVIGVACFVTSFSAMQALVIDFGADERFAWLIPVIIDGAIVGSSFSVIALSQHRDEWTVRGRLFLRRIEYTAAAVSVIMNSGHAYMTQHEIWRGLVAAAIGALAPLFLLAMTEAVEVLIRAPRRVAKNPNRDAHATAREGTPVPEAQGTTDNSTDPIDEWDGGPQGVLGLIHPSHEDMSADDTDYDALTPRSSGYESPYDFVLPAPLPVHASVDERLERALTLNAMQVQPDDIATHVGRSRATVYRWLKEARESESRPMVPAGRLVGAGM
ncbi:hypothetical protein JOJ86_007435 [Rhodococcus percolatus]|uniref:DUF2637 domain-containing protein n=1 Tax=Rhodococcus opacus TaxID=37919 RepID=UPI0015FCEA66|nr:DUF2637 domain-containing protein [Rhodococcus opacus]MBA8965069.1 hypothetical protein [Rhodococcus opacus]MBP2209642.1 hypothetical protein [Rhodococcus opacus]